MPRKYTDIFGKPLTTKDVIIAVKIVTKFNNPKPIHLSRTMKIGNGKATQIITLLQDAGVVSGPDTQIKRVLLTDPDQATNAALRQLKKGKK